MEAYKLKRGEASLKASPKRIALGKWIREQRDARGLTMRDLSAISGKPHSYFGKIEQAQRGLDILEFIELCNWLNIDAQKGLKEIKLIN
ncbi:helix-turn-helix domain-containing protein [Rheinheimera baltica]|uniref:Helix-turn-helix domain-containing protein n=1 Tax=Rheinheimera baltica TaxID=67576 RepID=A0ABT9I000_9GAMM|nr:helix-turn-helix domain-containing protein [Rheinheimera baltica]MDP5136718.1 helix-turn-helix domain-containing protein [Rheinheimera baltica]